MYKFNKEKHIHTFNGKPLMGVTSVLSVISKPALIQWSANMAVDYIQYNLLQYYNEDKLFDLYKEAKSAHRKKKEKAGDWGTRVHEAIEMGVRILIDEAGGEARECDPLKIVNNLDEVQTELVKKFFDWAKDNEVKFLECEKNLWSEKLWIGGIVDLVFEMKGQKYIGDIKTSSGIYKEAFFQMGAYHLMLEELGVNDISVYLVINLKKTGEMDFKMAENMKLNQEAFKHALGLYKIINSIE